MFFGIPFLWFLISIHALHEESDPRSRTSRNSAPFQSTLSMRRATFAPAQNALNRQYISIHALHEESDVGLRKTIGVSLYFNPRSP